MFFGQYIHSIDKKGRVFIPSKFREELGEKFILCKSIDGKRCLCVYSMEEWKILDSKLKSLPTVKASKLLRFLYSGAADLECDAQGRILIPQNLREYASIETETAVLGMSTRLEIWNSADFVAEEQQETPESIAELAGDLSF